MPRLPQQDDHVPIDMPALPRAACVEHDPEVWFPRPLQGRPQPTRQAPGEAAKAVCAGCPERAPCLAYALEQAIPHGVWGGLDQQARARLTGKVPQR